jgi:hypothetical protein
MKKALLLAAGGLALGGTLWSTTLLSHEVVNTSVTFDREIVRILNRKCIACHSDSNLGVPFTTYEQTRPWARAIEEEVLRRHMPPWRAVRGYGQFVNDLALTNRELQFIVAWVEGNGPKTKDQRLIVNVDQGRTPESERLTLDVGSWQLGEPELLKTLPSHSVAPGTDRWIRGLEFKPGDRRVVRAAFFFVQETGQWLGSWTPWYGITTLPEKAAFRVPAGTHLVAEIHYRSAGEAIDDRGRLGIYFAPAPAAHAPRDLVVAAKKDVSTSSRPRLTGSIKVPGDLSVLAFRPDLAPGIDSLEVSARMPDGRVDVLLLLRDILPQWPTPYIFKDPVRLPKDAELSWTAYAKDPAAPLPDEIKLTASVF